MTARRAALLLIACAALVTLTGLLTAGYVSRRVALEQAAFADAQAQSSAATAEINRVFGSLMALAEGLANDLTTGALAYTDIQARMFEEVARRPDIDGIAITFEPFVYDPQLRLYQAYVYQTADGSYDLLDGASYDYSIPPDDETNGSNTAWYHGPLRGGAMWNEPFFATGAGKILIEYGTPFRKIESSVPAGVVTVDYSLQGMRDQMAALDLGATGYGMVLSGSGTLLAHPVAEFVAASTIFDVAAALDSPVLREVGERALRGEQFSLESVDSITGQTVWIFVEPIRTSGWSLVLVLNRAEFTPDSRDNLQEQVGILLSGAGAFYVGLLGVLSLRGSGRPQAIWWTASILFALLCAVVIVMIWRLTIDVTPNHAVRITDRVSLDRYLEGYFQRAGLPQPTEIPTGVFVQTFAFPDATSVVVNGYVWQRFPRDLAEEVEPGVLFPQQLGEEAILDEVGVYAQGDTLVYVYYFGIVFKQAFDPSRFPLDARDIAIRLTPLDLDADIVLTPDLDAFDFIAPVLLPGLDSELRVPNWRINSSVHSYRVPNYNTSFGLQARAERGRVPELVFNIHTRRDSLGPFITYLLPAAVAALLLFGFLMNELKPDERDEVATTLNFVAAMFFVLVLAQTALRDNLAAVGLTYLEYLYILLYFAVVTISVNTFLIVNKSESWFIRYGNNIVPRLLYWPVIGGVMLAVTLLIFVYG